jgi:hypothetical protein
MKIGRLFIILLAATAVFSISGEAQTKKPVRRTTPVKRTTTTLPPLEVRAARVKVSNQYANVSAFTSRLGPIAQAIEAIDAESKTKKLRKETLDKNAADKQKVVAAIRGLREGMVKLESEFKVKPDLRKYLPMIQGISDLAGQSEASAIAGKFVAANAPLKTVQQKLNDTLTAMPNAEL